MRRAKRILLIGGGHSHVQVLEHLASEPLAGAEVRLVVDQPIAIYSGMVPGYVAGQYRAAELQIDIPRLCRWAKVECVVEPVVRIDAAGNKVMLGSGHFLDYDLASVNIGSTVAGLDQPGIRPFAIPTRPIAELLRRTDEVVARAAGRTDPGPFRVLVVGGGAGGVELAFTFGERLRQVAEGEIEILLIHAGPRILEGYPASLARQTELAAAGRGIGIHCGRRVRSATVDRVELDGDESWPYDVLLWVTGAVSHSLFRDSGLVTDDRGFILTRPTLQVCGHDDLYAVGDCATMIDHPRTPKAGVFAVRQGPILSHNLSAHLAGEPLQLYTPQSDFLTLLNLGDGTAVGVKKKVSFQGRWVMWLKDWIDRRFMRRFQVGAAPGSH